jgi:hypothetical protein
VPRPTLELVCDSNKTLVVPVGVRVVLDQVQIGPVGQRAYIRVAIRAIHGQVRTPLTIVNLGPVRGDSRDVVRFEDFLDAVYSVPTVDYWPGTIRDSEQFFDIQGWLHYNLQTKLLEVHKNHNLIYINGYIRL